MAPAWKYCECSWGNGLSSAWHCVRRLGEESAGQSQTPPSITATNKRDAILSKTTRKAGAPPKICVAFGCSIGVSCQPPLETCLAKVTWLLLTLKSLPGSELGGGWSAWGREGRPAGPEPGCETGVVQQGQSLLVSFVEVRLAQGLHDEGILLFIHELGQRLGQGAPVALLAQGVQQDPRQVLGRHLAERAGSGPGPGHSPLMWPECPPPTSRPCQVQPLQEAHHSTPRSPSVTAGGEPASFLLAFDGSYLIFFPLSLLDKRYISPFS